MPYIPNVIAAATSKSATATSTDSPLALMFANATSSGTTYGGKFGRIRDGLSSKAQLTERLQEFKGIGPTAARIFLREMPPDWKDPSGG